jgi:hypothetical protein
MNFDIKSPVEGKVTLDLTWDEAEVLTRVLGLTNSGNLRKHAPGLHEFVQSMVVHVGRGVSGEASKYVAEVGGGQVYVKNKDEEW